MRKELQVTDLQIGQRVKTDTGRNGTVLQLSVPFNQVLIQFDNATPDAWWPVSNLEVATTPDKGAITTRWARQIAVILYASPFERLTDAQRSVCSDVALYSWTRGRAHVS